MNNKRDNIILILLIAPVLGVIIQAYISSILLFNFSNLWIITIALNLFLAIYDSEILKRNNQYSKEMGNPMLIPIYIYKRTKILNNNPIIYTLIWCILIIVVSATSSVSIINMLGLGL